MTDRSFWLRRPRIRNPYVLDGLIAAGIGIAAFIGFLTVERTPHSDHDADVLGAVLVLAAAASLVFRRRWPVAVFGITLAATVAFYVLDYPDSGLPFTVLIALYTLASRCERRTTVAATAAVLLVIPFVIADSAEFDVGTLIGNWAVFTVAAVWGDRKKVRDAYYEQLELRAAEKERERLEAAERAVADERLRIARELHDVVAHAMSVVAVQSGVGAHVIDTRPEEAKRILETISQTSRDSLAEMRRLLGVLRADPAAESGELAPAPGLAALPELAARVTEAGVPVEVIVRGERPEVPTGADLAAYRIVQEALTNVIKHAGKAQASVLVRYEPDAVHVEVVDDGRGAGAAATDTADNGSHHGLVGMRERAALYDGTLEAGPRPGGGYRVAATLRCEGPTA